jgi:hypothetical protein
MKGSHTTDPPDDKKSRCIFTLEPIIAEAAISCWLGSVSCEDHRIIVVKAPIMILDVYHKAQNQK